MPKYVALLRGIAPMNPNMRNVKLCALFEELGFTHVGSVISSGNITFQSPATDTSKLESRIEAALPKKLDFASTTIIRSLDSLQQLVKSNPFGKFEHTPKTSLNVTFLKHTPKVHPPIEGHGFYIVSTSDSEICSVIDTTSSKTPNYMAKLEKTYGTKMTTRTWKTVERIIIALS